MAVANTAATWAVNIQKGWFVWQSNVGEGSKNLEQKHRKPRRRWGWELHGLCFGARPSSHSSSCVFLFPFPAVSWINRFNYYISWLTLKLFWASASRSHHPARVPLSCGGWRSLIRALWMGFVCGGGIRNRAFKHTVDAKSIFVDIIKPTKGLVWGKDMALQSWVWIFIGSPQNRKNPHFILIAVLWNGVYHTWIIHNLKA